MNSYFKLLLLVVLIRTPTGQARIRPQEDFGFRAGLSFSLGTLKNRLGLSFDGFHHSRSFQQNMTIHSYYNFKTFGPPLKGPELKLGFGLVYGYGQQKRSRSNYFLSTISNQTLRQNSVAYAINLYLDQIKTSQFSGTFAFEHRGFLLATDNDLFIFTGKDRYRTGGFLFYFRDDKLQFGFKAELWTGDTKINSKRIVGQTGRFGYKDLSDSPYGKLSHGLFLFQISRANKFTQITQASIGIDSEWVRHFIQNEFIHDMPFLPDFMITHKNLHVPMLDTLNRPFLNEKGQKIKPAKIFAEVSLNPNLFY